MLCYATEVPRPAMFAGDDDTLIEHLVAACARKEVVGELHQRDLKPFNFDEFDTFASKQTFSRKDSPYGKQTASKAVKKAAGAIQSANSSPSVSATASPTANTTPERRPAANRTKPLRNNGVPLKMQSGHAGVFNLSATPIKTAACPGFFSSPKPEAIPMPTSSFLNRAASGKA